MKSLILRKSLALVTYGLLLFATLAFFAKDAEADTGYATYYDGLMGASGDYLNSGDYHTCAVNMNYDGSPVIPFGTKLGIYYNGIYTYCYVTDVGGMSWFGYTLDMHTPVAEELGTTYIGVAPVEYWVIRYDRGWFYGKQY